MNTTNEHNKRPIPANFAEMPSTEIGHVGGSVPLKKGPWTPDEDAILVDYVLKHGEGKWSNIYINTPLARCGKSCRLRWINHLRPDLKKGPLTREEERRIVELHAVMGNKWSQIATELPGRTDNEIKNFWNTRVKRHQRIGLPIYPPCIIPQALNENQQSGSTNLFSSGDVYRPNFAPNNPPYIPALEFISLENNEPLYPPSLLDISTISLPLHIQNAYEHCLTSNHASPSGACLGNHAAINGNDFLSDRAQSLELELPSLQSQTSSLGLNQIQSAECSQSCNLATDDSDSLEAILHESKRLKITKNNYHQQTSHAFDMADDVMDTLFQDLHETNWEDRSLHGGDLLDVPLSIETISDFLLGSNSSCGMDITEDHALLGDAIGTFFRQ